MGWKNVTGREELGNLASEAGYSCGIIWIFIFFPPTFPLFLCSSLMIKGFSQSYFLFEFNVSVEIKDVCFPLA